MYPLLCIMCYYVRVSSHLGRIDCFFLQIIGCFKTLGFSCKSTVCVTMSVYICSIQVYTVNTQQWVFYLYTTWPVYKFVNALICCVLVLLKMSQDFDYHLSKFYVHTLVVPAMWFTVQPSGLVCCTEVYSSFDWIYS